MTTRAVSGRRYFTQSAALSRSRSLPAGADRDCFDVEPQLFTVNNLFNILQQTSVNAIMAVGMTLVILTSGIDLSVGSRWRSPARFSLPLQSSALANALVAVAAALALGAAIGAVTGVIVAKGRVQAFIATLVMMLLLRGVTMVYTDGSPVNTGFTDNADPFGCSVSAVRPLHAGLDHVVLSPARPSPDAIYAPAYRATRLSASA
ncbi:hypothetical protein KCP77_01575 [Salmonella enterica subsp. enterica]|nr:hypothetical protein KCP77_01575 [Salmonella enterica subsp. enterica]